MLAGAQGLQRLARQQLPDDLAAAPSGRGCAPDQESVGIPRGAAGEA